MRQRLETKQAPAHDLETIDMKPRLLPFLYSLLLLASLLTACNPSGKDNQQLASVEQLLDSGRVDTACAVLDGVRLNRLTTPADSAYYYLLKTQADYRTNHPLVSLDDIEYSIRYYEGKGSEKLRLSASLFYKSAILYTHGSFKEGVLCLERARTIADQTQDAVLRHKVYEQLTLVNEEAGDFRTALRFSQKSIAESKQAKRLDWLAHTYNNMAFIYSQLGLQDSTAWCLRQSMELLPNIAEKNRPFIMNNLGSFLMETDTAMARKYLEESLEITPTSPAYACLGTLAAMRGDTARATKMWHEALIIAPDTPSEELVLKAIMEFRSEQGEWREATMTAKRLLQLSDSVSRARPENNVRAVQSEFEQMRISHNYERMVTIAIIVIVVLVLLTIIATLYSWYRNYKGRAARAVDQLLIKSYETQLNELKRMAGDKTKEIEQLTRKRDLLMEKHRDSLKLGLQRYNEAMAGQTTVLWKKHDFESFASYYSLVDVEYVASLDAEYDGLSPKQKFFLIMEHMDKSEGEIQNALGVAEVTMRSIRSRIGKKHKA